MNFRGFGVAAGVSGAFCIFSVKITSVGVRAIGKKADGGIMLHLESQKEVVWLLWRMSGSVPVGCCTIAPSQSCHLLIRVDLTGGARWGVSIRACVGVFFVFGGR
jgi:hypothetical protein